MKSFNRLNRSTTRFKTYNVAYRKLIKRDKKLKTSKDTPKGSLELIPYVALPEKTLIT